jgi:hypothetical protein
MDFEVLPGPSLSELARTALARAAAAEICAAPSVGDLASTLRVSVRGGRDGSPLLLPATGSLLERRLAASPETVTVSVPAGTPYSVLRLTGTARPATQHPVAGVTACRVDVRSVELVGGVRVQVPLAEYRAATPDPLWRVAPGVLRHLEHGHMADLVACVHAHGMPQADWVIPRRLDRYGLELLVLTVDGTAAVRLAFPDGPVTALHEVPASIRTTLTCRCQSASGQHDGHAASA